MEKSIERPARKAIIKFSIFILYIILAMNVDVSKFALVQNCLTKEWLESVGFLAPFVYIVIYATGICLLIPGTLLTGLGAATFWGHLGISLCLAGGNGWRQRCLLDWAHACKGVRDLVD